MLVTYAEAFYLTKSRKWDRLKSLCAHMNQSQLRLYIRRLYKTAGDVGSPVSLAEDIAWGQWLKRFRAHPTTNRSKSDV